jgi:hypothetical protein
VLKSKLPPVRRGGRSRPAGARPRVEELETRDLMSVSIGIVNGPLIVSGGTDSAGHIITLDHAYLISASDAHPTRTLFRRGHADFSSTGPEEGELPRYLQARFGHVTCARVFGQRHAKPVRLPETQR